MISDNSHTFEMCEQALEMVSTWHKADRVQRNAILKEMFEAIYVNTVTKEIVGVKPYAEFVALFKQSKLIESDYLFVLKNEEAAQQQTERLPVSGGSDGIRSSARREDRFYRPRPFVR